MTVTKPVKGTAFGRLDVMGGIIDYSGGLVVQKLLKENTTVAFTPRNDGRCLFSSNCCNEWRSAEVHLSELLKDGGLDLAFAAAFFKTKEESKWVSYVAGCFLVLMRNANINFLGGEFEIHSTVPLGKGVSSSAALEMATMRALNQHFKTSETELTLASWAQIAENEVAAAPCGLMDQLSCTFGEHGKLLPILCQPDLVKKAVEIPDHFHFVGLDSGHRHAVGESPYTLARCATFMGFTILLQKNELTHVLLNHYKISGDRTLLPYEGYLCNINYHHFFLHQVSRLPEKISGQDFINQFGDHTDLVTTIEPEKLYPVRSCTAHALAGHKRAQDFLKALAQYDSSPEVVTQLLGKLMLESHRGYSECGLGSPYTDRIIELSLGVGNQLIAGGRISGGGSGGTVCLLALGQEGLEAVLGIKDLLEQELEKELRLFL